MRRSRRSWRLVSHEGIDRSLQILRQQSSESALDIKRIYVLTISPCSPAHAFVILLGPKEAMKEYYGLTVNLIVWMFQRLLHRVCQRKLAGSRACDNTTSVSAQWALSPKFGRHARIDENEKNELTLPRYGVEDLSTALNVLALPSGVPPSPAKLRPALPSPSISIVIRKIFLGKLRTR